MIFVPQPDLITSWNCSAQFCPWNEQASILVIWSERECVIKREDFIKLSTLPCIMRVICLLKNVSSWKYDNLAIWMVMTKYYCTFHALQITDLAVLSQFYIYNSEVCTGMFSKVFNCNHIIYKYPSDISKLWSITILPWIKQINFPNPRGASKVSC